MAAGMTALLGYGRRFEPGDRGHLRPITEIAVQATRESARA